MANKITVKENFDMVIDTSKSTKWYVAKLNNDKYINLYEQEMTDELKAQITEIETMDFSTHDAFNHMDCENGFIELREGIFYFDWGNCILYVVKWLDVNEQGKKKIMKDIKKDFRYMIASY